MHILVTFAVEAEFAPWAKLRQFQEKQVAADHGSGGFKAFEARVADHTVWVHLTGIGCPALRSLALGAQHAGADVLISSGLTGSLRKEHSVGEVVAPRRIGTLRDATGLAASPELLRLAERHGAKLVDTLLTADHIVESGEEKSRLARLADVVDMESHRIIKEFAFSNLPAAAIRAVSDGSDEDLPVDFSRCLTVEGKLKPGPLLKSLLESPSKVPDLIRFGARSKRAARNLAQFMDSFVRAITPQTVGSEAGVVAK